MRGTIPEDSAAPHQSLLDRRTPVADLPAFLSPEEFRAYLGLSKTLVYELLRRGDIPHRRFGRCIRIPKSALSKVE
jgi:excisionase family DNA binding protein